MVMRNTLVQHNSKSMEGPLGTSPISSYQGSIIPIEQQISRANESNKFDSTPYDSEKKTIGDDSYIIISDSELDDVLEDAKGLDSRIDKYIVKNNHSSSKSLGTLLQKKKEKQY